MKSGNAEFWPVIPIAGYINNGVSRGCLSIEIEAKTGHSLLYFT